MAESQMWISLFRNESAFQIRIGGFSPRSEKVLCRRLNIEAAADSLARMDGYEDLRGDDYFAVGEKGAQEICFTCEEGRLALASELIREEGMEVRDGADLIPGEERVKQMLTRDGAFAEEISHLVEENLPFYRRGTRAFLTGFGLRIGILLLLLIVGRIIFLAKADKYQPRSFAAVIKTVEAPYEGSNVFKQFFAPTYTHRSLLKISKSKYIKGNKIILEGGFYIQIEGLQSLKGTMEKHNYKPLMLRIDSRSGEMMLADARVEDDVIAHKGKVVFLGRYRNLVKQPPQRIDATASGVRSGYMIVRDADPKTEETFTWMLGKYISVTARLTSDGDRYLVGEDEFKFAIPKDSVRPEVREIMDLAAASNERTVVDMLLSSKPYPYRNKRDPRKQRRDQNIITEGSLHYIQLQQAIFKNI